MVILSLSLKNFRNFTDEKVEFSNNINLICGKNAQGKTNLAEAIFLLCTGYSTRASKDKYLIRDGQDKAEISGVADSVYGKVTVKIEINKNDKKRIFINGMEVHKIGELMGNINSVFFNPQELKLVQESPEDRRRFMNVSLSQMSKNYFYALQRYNKILAERNKLLKEEQESVIRQTLPIWDVQFAKQASIIIKARNEFLKILSPYAQEKHALLSNGKEILTMQTESGYYGTNEEIEYALVEDLKTSIFKDIRLGFTTIGPHRDDIKFSLNGKDARHFASQGQQRTIALALKLAETEIFKDKFNEYPILILDDVLSELDTARQRKLIFATKDIQTIFTATAGYPSLFKNSNYVKTVIENGKVKK